MDRLPIWAFFLVLVLLATASMEAGFFWGRRAVRRNRVKKSALGSLVATHMGLLALMLAFTFGFAAARLDTRKGLVIAEANAIGTAALRSRLMLEPYASNVQRLLAEYTELRAVRLPEGRIPLEVALSESHRLLVRLWVETELASSQSEPAPEIRALFVSSVNAVIDLHTQRITVITLGRIPPLIWLTLAAITVLGLGSLGYENGVGSPRRSLVGIPLVLSFCSAILVIIDLDRPLGTLVHVSQKPLLETLESIAEGDSAAR